jgi:hypothetical protein
VSDIFGKCLEAFLICELEYQSAQNGNIGSCKPIGARHSVPEKYLPSILSTEQPKTSRFTNNVFEYPQKYRKKGANDPIPPGFDPEENGYDFSTYGSLQVIQ